MEFRRKVAFGLNKKELSDDGTQIRMSGAAVRNPRISPPLDGLNDILLDQFYENTKHYLMTMQKSNYSVLQNELCDQTRTRALFQEKVFGKTGRNFDILPQSAFASFSVSLRLVLTHNSFSFYSINPGFEVHENFEDNGRTVLEYISRGVLPPGTLNEVRKLNLTWYDGGLICEVEDQRRKFKNVMRILLQVHERDVANVVGADESEYLLAKYPLLSFDADLQVSRITRTVYNDKVRWKDNEANGNSPKQFVQLQYPEMFIEKEKDVSTEDESSPAFDFTNEDLQKKLAELAL